MLHAHVDAADLILDHFEPLWFWAEGGLLFLLGCLGLAPLRLETDLGSHGTVQVSLRKVLLVAIGGLLLLGIGAALLFWLRLGGRLAGELGGLYLRRWGPFCLAALVLGLLLRLIVQRQILPKLSRQLRAWRIMQPTETPSDIRTEIAAHRALDFRPADFYQPGQVLVGLNQDGQPVQVELAEWREINKTVVGATRTGKGITYQIWAEQAVARGDTVILVDPKRDRFLPQVVKQAADAAGRRFIVLDLSDPASPGAWSPFQGGSPADRRSRFFDILELTDRGTDADHYKALAREQLFALFDSATNTTLPALLDKVIALSEAGDDAAKALSTVRARLKEWASHPKLCPKPGKGFKVELSLTQAAVVYVVGSLDDGVIRAATRAFLQEVIQEARRLQPLRTSHLSLFIDELKFLASDTIVKALATIAGFDAEIVTAYQNFGDLLNPDDARLDGRAVLQAVQANSQIKLIFGGTDPQTADYVSEASGTRLKKIARFERTQINRSGGETWARQRMLADQEEPLIPVNTVLALPRRVAVLLRPKHLAEVVSVAPVPVKAAPVDRPVGS
jgi:hypothetical protein